MIRAVIIAITLTFAATAFAADAKPPVVVSCPAVRAKVAELGLYGAYVWAKANGYSEQQIGEAMKCRR